MIEVSALALLFVRSASGGDEAATVAVFEIVPKPAEHFTVPVRTIVAEAPFRRAEKVTVRVFPVPPHTPPPSEEQESKERTAGRLSVTTTFDAPDGPRFLTVIV